MKIEINIEAQNVEEIDCEKWDYDYNRLILLLENTYDKEYEKIPFEKLNVNNLTITEIFNIIARDTFIPFLNPLEYLKNFENGDVSVEWLPFLEEKLDKNYVSNIVFNNVENCKEESVKKMIYLLKDEVQYEVEEALVPLYGNLKISVSLGKGK